MEQHAYQVCCSNHESRTAGQASQKLSCYQHGSRCRALPHGWLLVCLIKQASIAVLSWSWLILKFLELGLNLENWLWSTAALCCERASHQQQRL